MNDQSNMPAVQEERTPLAALKNQVGRKTAEFKSALPSHISVEKFQRTIAMAAMSNSFLLDCDRATLLTSAMKAAQDGLLPDGREAALVPFSVWDKASRQKVWQVQYLPMVYGLRKKILQSGEVISLEVGVVYRAEIEGGHFLYEIGIEPPIRHRPKLDMTDEEINDDEIVAAYSIARIRNGDGEPYWSVEVMRRAEINKVRQMSQTGAVGKTDRNGKPIPPKGPWVEWFSEMAKKTVMRRHSKVLPMSGDILESVLREDEEFIASGAARILDHAPENEGKALPSTSDLDDDEDEADAETIDQETGEIIEQDSRGMTEVNEETARKLDAGEQEPSEEPEEEVEPEDESTEENTAEEGEAEQAAPDPHAGQPYAVKRAELLAAIEAAVSKTALNRADSEVAKHYAVMPSKVQDELDRAIMKKRREIG